MLGSASGPSLRTRYEEIYDEQPTCVRELLGEKSDFVSYTLKVRNLLAHGGRPDESGEELLNCGARRGNSG